MSSQDYQRTETTGIDDHLLAYFQDGARVLGLPKSVGEIYGVLYITPVPLTMIDLVDRLSISKGSASQGLKILRNLGAVREIDLQNDRKTYFQADVELKKLVGGFIREKVRPHLNSGQEKLNQLRTKAQNIDDPELREFYDERIHRLERWSSKSNLILPLLQKFLGE